MNDSEPQLTTSTVPVPKLEAAYRVVASGEIDLATAPQLTETLDSYVRRGTSLIVRDATAIEFVDSSELRAIVGCSTALAERSG